MPYLYDRIRKEGSEGLNIDFLGNGGFHLQVLVTVSFNPLVLMFFLKYHLLLGLKLIKYGVA